MGKAKSEPDLATKIMAAWTSDDVKHWLKEHESLNKYTKQLKVLHAMMPMHFQCKRNPLTTTVVLNAFMFCRAPQEKSL